MFYKLLLLFLFIPLVNCSDDTGDEESPATNLGLDSAEGLVGIWLGAANENNDSDKNSYTVYGIRLNSDNLLEVYDYCGTDQKTIYQETDYDTEQSRFNMLSMVYREGTSNVARQAVLEIGPSGATGNNNIALGSATTSNDDLDMTKLPSDDYSCEKKDTGLTLVANDYQSDCYDTDGTTLLWGQGNGRANLKCASAYIFDVTALNINYTTDDGTDVEEDSVVTDTNTTLSEPDSAGNVYSTTCITTDYTLLDNPTLANLLVVSYSAQIWPGNLIYGNNYINNGAYDPITVSSGRGGIEYNITGISLNRSSTFNVDDDLTVTKYNDARNVAINDDTVVGTMAKSSYTLEEVHSTEQLEFSLTASVDLSTGGGALSTNWGSDSDKNYFLATFYQIVYNINIDTPKTTYAFFNTDEDGQFEDEENALKPANPPLYFDDVGYGRQMFVSITTSSEEEDIDLALSASYNSGDVNVQADVNFTYATTLEESTIVVSGIGGDATVLNAVAAAASSGTGEELSQAINDYITDGAKFDGTDYVPILYTLRYLNVENATAATAFNTSYTTNSCADAVVANYKLKLDITGIDNSVYIWYDNCKDTGVTGCDSVMNGTYKNFITPGDTTADVQLDGSGGTPIYITTDTFPTNSLNTSNGNDHFIRIQLDNDDCFGWSISYTAQSVLEEESFVTDTSGLPERHYIHGSDDNWTGICDWTKGYILKFNTATGNIDQTKAF